MRRQVTCVEVEIETETARRLKAKADRKKSRRRGVVLALQEHDTETTEARRARQRLEDLEASARATLRPDEICAGQFIAGPIPLVDLARVMRLTGAAGQVWLLAFHRTRIMRRAEVHIPRPLLALFGITPSAASRAYHALGEAGEAEVTREPGCAVRLRLKMLADEGI